jgi:hypothetical protein
MGLTCTLCKKRKDVARNEHLGHPVCPDQGVFFGAEHPDQPAEDHVDGGGEQSRTEEDEEALHDVGA